MITTSEITSRTTAIAEPYPMRLDSPMMLLVTRIDSSSVPWAPPLKTYTRSKARSASMIVTTRTMVLVGRRVGKMTFLNVCHSLAPSSEDASRSDGSTPFRPAR